MVTRPAGLPVRPSWLAVILVGGSIGTGIRAGLSSAFPHGPGEWPWATFGINLTGALLLGILLEVLAGTGPDRGWRRVVRLGLGTGVLGGFTTYSTFAVETVELLRAGAWLAGIGYALGSVLVGLVAAWSGVLLARRGLARVRRAQGGIG